MRELGDIAGCGDDPFITSEECEGELGTEATAAACDEPDELRHGGLKRS